MAETDHEGATGGIDRQVLPGQTANHAHLSEGFLMDFFKGVRFTIEPQHDDAATVRADENEICIVSCML